MSATIRPPGLHHTPPADSQRTVDPVQTYIADMARAAEELRPEENKAPAVEKEARSIVEGARQQDYGGPEDSFARIARLWNAYLANLGLDGSLTPGDVALMMDLMKTARLVTAPSHRDSIVDKIGYTIAYAKSVGVEP